MDKNVQWILNDKYGGIGTEEFERDILRIQRGEPVDYVIGWVPFLGCLIDLSLRPFIPRTETEYWVKCAMDEIKAMRGEIPARILDIFSGSGAIGVALLKHLPNVRVDLAEKDTRCIRQIQKNIELNGIDMSRVTIIQSDCFENVHGEYDMMFANPPYVPFSRKDVIARSVREYELVDAVFGGEDGLIYIRKFLAGAKQYLTPQGVIWMEFDAPEKDKICDLISDCGYASSEFFPDQFGMWRFVKISG